MNCEEGGGNKDQEKGKDGTKSRSKMWWAILRKKKKKKRNTTRNRLMKTENSWTSGTLCTFVRVCVCFNRVCQTYS